MGHIAIRVEGLGKKYRIGRRKSGNLRESLAGIFSRKQFNDSTVQPGGSDFWALRDVNFEVKQGEAVGIIGRNGAGKSTLLKILSRITKPTTGRFEINGRVSSLLEVGTGFHMELTGRENIYLNGTILGMKRREIKEKFDEIVAFSGVEEFIDTPVKHYSSGMKVRLAFSVAAHLEPEILIIDEVLAVGDAEFQKKCLGKMEDVAGQGRTVLFVSHNMGAVKNLCTRAISLADGVLKLDSTVDQVIQDYLFQQREPNYIYMYKNHLSNEVSLPYIKKITLNQNQSTKNSSIFSINKPLSIYIEFEKFNVKNIFLTVLVKNEFGLIIHHSTDEFAQTEQFLREDSRVCTVPAYALNTGKYSLTVAIAVRNKIIFEKLEDVLSFEIEFFGGTSELNTKDSWKGFCGPGALLWS